MERVAVQAVDTLLLRACEKYADATAITSSSESITYTELLERAREVAGDLEARGIGKGDVVAVLGRRSASVVVAVFGVWMAGSIVMLVDEALPDVRRETMLDSGPVRATISCADGRRIALRPDPDPAPAGEGSAPAVLDDADHAYVAFTSGSTGKPKAIIGSHTGLSLFLRWQSDEFSIGPDDRFAHLTNLSFDVWFRDALTPLISGAALCVPDELHLDADGVLDFLRSRRITALHLVPSLGKLWTAGAAETEPVPTVRHAFFAGEPLDGALVSRWRELFPSCQVVNLYGPTETTLAQHFYRVPQGVTSGIQQVGRNLPQSTSYVLDDDKRLCADDAVGQIFIAADHPSHGYLVDGRIVSPFVEIHVGGERIVAYPTGDLGRRTGQGGLEILGRADEQIKIAGVRIELQEVRSAIQSHPSVRDVFVCAQEDRFTKVIVAVLEGDATAEQDLRDYLNGRLMSVMLPSAFLFVPELLKLPNGKVDRKALAEVARAHVQDRARRAIGTGGPGRKTGPVPDRLERIWLAVTGNGAARLADRESTFFGVGGTSLTIAVLHAEIQAEFGVRFPLVRLFEHASFNAQRRFLEAMTKEPGGNAPSTAAAAPGAAGRRRVLSARRSRQL
ncbi:non-ribosomal peptide synthetase [Streptomyces sp. NBC_01351]|uniref:non-ribosomal peptide synthetase n=1 Tax=Streptomyces sp. NBC_01351 TaxID=2903833 RepID=UPI002E2ECAEE|nr:non-ribosomal peptide synthetase [Streptomyces sp. NBC_01351]